MRQSLRLHPDSHCAAVTGVDVEIARPRPGGLALRYFVTGQIAGLRVPSAAEPARADELWRTTCFEAFVRSATGPAYYELNFAPSTQWAAYRFDGYRDGMSVANEIGAPRIETRSRADGLELHAAVDLDQAADLAGGAPWSVGVAAVIEEANGAKSYWALAHPPGKADFHHADGFAHELPALEHS